MKKVSKGYADDVMGLSGRVTDLYVSLKPFFIYECATNVDQDETKAALLSQESISEEDTSRVCACGTDGSSGSDGDLAVLSVCSDMRHTIQHQKTSHSSDREARRKDSTASAQTAYLNA